MHAAVVSIAHSSSLSTSSEFQFSTTSRSLSEEKYTTLKKNPFLDTKSAKHGRVILMSVDFLYFLSLLAPSQSERDGRFTNGIYNNGAHTNTACGASRTAQYILASNFPCHLFPTFTWYRRVDIAMNQNKEHVRSIMFYFKIFVYVALAHMSSE